MEALKCPNCKKIFNSESRLAKFSGKCGQSICSECLHQITSSSSPCPYCLQPIDENEFLGDNLQIMDFINFVEIKCVSHPDKIACQINLELTESYCELCEKQGQNLISPEEFSLTLNIALEELLKSQLSQLVKKEVETQIELYKSIDNSFKKLNKFPYYQEAEKRTESWIMGLSNNIKFRIIREVKLAANKVTCDQHQLKEAQFISISTRKLLCLECVTVDEDSILSLTSNDLIEVLVNRIMWIKRSMQHGTSEVSSLNFNELKSLTFKQLIKILKDFDQSDVKNLPVFLKSSCGSCGMLYSKNREPYILPCVGTHIICQVCAAQAEINCPYDNNSYLPSDLEAFFCPFFNPTANCAKCRSPFNFKGNFPREFPCGHLLCVSCLKLMNSSRNSIKKCFECNTQVESLKSLPSNQYVIEVIRQNLIYCSRHRNISAEFIDKLTLTSYCCKCEDYYSNHKFNIVDPFSPVARYLVKVFKMNANDENVLCKVNLSLEQFKALSPQEMIDKLRENTDSSLSEKLRSSMPQGKCLIDVPKPEWGKSNAYLLRFLTIMPNEHKVLGNYNITSPWIVLPHENQVEAVVIKPEKDIKLYGLIFGTIISSPIAHAHINLIKIIKGKSLIDKEQKHQENIKKSSTSETDEKLVYIDEVSFDIRPEPDYQTIMLRETVFMKKNQPYSVIVRVRGEGILLTRGNPFDLKEELLGSDGTKFEFTEPEDIGFYEINGQHDINGPFLGLIYE